MKRHGGRVKKARISDSLRAEVYDASRDENGIPRCSKKHGNGCGISLVGKRWQADHITEEWAGGKTTADNLEPLCIPCHEAKSARKTTDRAHADRVHVREIGAHRAECPMRGGRDDDLKKKVGGGAVPRERVRQEIRPARLYRAVGDSLQ